VDSHVRPPLSRHVSATVLWQHEKATHMAKATYRIRHPSIALPIKALLKQPFQLALIVSD
jgi:hypothetical protein